MKTFTAVISGEAREYASLLRENFDVLCLKPDTDVAPEVSCHADMIIFSCGQSAVMPEKYIEKYPAIAEYLSERCGTEIIKSTAPRGKEYPSDVSLNVLLCGNYAFSLKKATADEAASLIENNGIRHLNVKQGYSACSTLALKNGLITADPAIASAAESHDIACLRISSGHIKLSGYSEGFIGGASGVCEKMVYFLGNIMTHPDGENILEFLESLGYEAVSLGNGDLEDFGGIRIFRNVV